MVWVRPPKRGWWMRRELEDLSSGHVLNNSGTSLRSPEPTSLGPSKGDEAAVPSPPTHTQNR